MIQAFLSLETAVGTGVGILRLAKDDEGNDLQKFLDFVTDRQISGTWKCFTLYTFLEELTGFPASVRKNRPQGVVHGESISRKTWLELRNQDSGEHPTVIIVGAGQAGLSTAARLQTLGIKALVIDRERKVGDNWRSRYPQLVLHDPVWFDHSSSISYK